MTPTRTASTRTQVSSGSHSTAKAPKKQAPVLPTVKEEKVWSIDSVAHGRLQDCVNSTHERTGELMYVYVCFECNHSHLYFSSHWISLEEC